MFRVRVSLVGPNFEETYPENQILFFQGAARSCLCMDAFGIDTPNAEEAGSQAQTLASGRPSLPEALSGLVRLLRLDASAEVKPSGSAAAGLRCAFSRSSSFATCVNQKSARLYGVHLDGMSGRRTPVCYTELSPTRFKNFWRE